MTIKIKMLIERRDPHGLDIKTRNLEDSVILLGDEVFDTRNLSQNTSGLEELLMDMFENINGMGVREVIAYSQMANTKPELIEDIVTIKPFKFLFKWGWQNADITPILYKKVWEVIGLITWIKSDHFKKEILGTCRTCIICAHVQQGNIQGYANLGNTPIVDWPSNYCTNPECISHKIEKMIDSDYEIQTIDEDLLRSARILSGEKLF